MAGSIDATYASDLNFSFWLEQHNQNIAGSIGLTYQGQIDQLTGGHSISYGDLMHISKFERSPFSNDFHVSANLPDATNPAFDVCNQEEIGNITPIQKDGTIIIIGMVDFQSP